MLIDRSTLVWFFSFDFYFLNLCRQPEWGDSESGIYAHTPSLIRFGSQRFSLKSRQRTINFWPFFALIIAGSDLCFFLFILRLLSRFRPGSLLASLWARSLYVFILRSQATEHNFNALYRAAPLRIRIRIRMRMRMRVFIANIDLCPDLGWKISKFAGFWVPLGQLTG